LLHRAKIRIETLSGVKTGRRAVLVFLKREKSSDLFTEESKMKAMETLACALPAAKAVTSDS
jgi:hypothetical protein